MGRNVNHFKIGLFFLISGAIVIGGLIWVGAAHFFQATKTYVTFFDESVGGLSPGASVSYLGLDVGRVASIGLAPDGKLIRVMMKLEPKFKVTKSMAIELELKGITGQRYLAIVKAPADIKKVTPTIDFSTEYPVIPARRGEITQIKDALEKVYKRIESADVEGLVNEWKKTAEDVNSILTSKKIQETLTNINDMSADLKTLIGPLSRPGNPEKWKKSFEDLAVAADATRKATETLATQLQKLPPGTFADLARRTETMVRVGEQSVSSMKKQVDQSLTILQQSLYQTNQVLSDLKALVSSLREEPGRIFERPRGSEPFRR